MEVILTDSEYTTWEGALESDWGEPWMDKEIVQTAAIKVDLDFNEVAVNVDDRLIVNEE